MTFDSTHSFDNLPEESVRQALSRLPKFSIKFFKKLQEFVLKNDNDSNANSFGDDNTIDTISIPFAKEILKLRDELSEEDPFFLSAVWSALLSSGYPRVAWDTKVSLDQMLRYYIPGLSGIFFGLAETDSGRTSKFGAYEFAIIAHSSVPMGSIDHENPRFLGSISLDFPSREKTVLMEDPLNTIDLPVYFRNVYFSPHAGNPKNGTSTCAAIIEGAFFKDDLPCKFLMTAKHVVPIMGAHIDMDPNGVGCVTIHSPDGIDAAFIEVEEQLSNKKLSTVKLVAPGSRAIILGKSKSTSTAIRSVSSIGHVFNSPLLPVRVDLSNSANPGDSGAAVVAENGDLIGIYMGGYSSQLMNTVGGIAQSAYQVELIMNAQFFKD